MTTHPDQLYAVDFTAADQERLVGFSCGDESWARLANEWIRGPDVLDSMSKWGTRVWLFEREDETIIGFGSIGKTRWRWPLPDGSRTTLVLIPMLGIGAQFRGQPSDPNWRYSRQIMSHLVAEANNLAIEWSGDADERPQWLVLQVHKDNERAIRFYEKCGFELIPDVEQAHEHLVMKLGIGD